MNYNYTTIEQSKHLLELGLNPDTADKVIVIDKGAEVEFTIDLMDEDDYNEYIHTFPNDMYIPCWSVGSLVEIMPMEILLYGSAVQLKIMKTSTGYTIEYSDFSVSAKRFISHSLMEGCYKMVIWLLENGYIKKGE